MGIVPLKDIRPQTIAAILESVYSSAYEIWKKRESEATYYDALNDFFPLIEEGINYSCVS